MFSEAYAVAGSSSSPIEGLKIFETIKEELKGKEASIIKIEKKTCGVGGTPPENLILDFSWYVVTWRAEKWKNSSFCILQDGRIVTGSTENDEN